MGESDERKSPPVGESAPANGRKDGGADDAGESSRTAPFGPVSLVIIVVLVIGTWFLIQSLSADTKMQDCIQSGRRNCAPIDDTRP